jgi:phage-related protein
MEYKFIRNILFYKNYYLEFYLTLNPEVKRKFDWTLKLIATTDKIPVKYFKHIEGSTGLFEIRVEYGSDIYRVFCFFDKGRLILILNGFQKKTQKTPAKEIKIAENLKKQYFDDKENK